MGSSGTAYAYDITCGAYGQTPSFACVSYTGYTGQQPWGYPVDANGHNCTNYVTYRLWQNGVTNPGNLGNAMDWDENATAYGIPVNNTAATGAVAVWEAYSGPALETGHVAYVEAVTSTYIDISEDNYGGTTMKKRFYVGQSGWPDHFIHFKDVPSTPPPPPPPPTTLNGSVVPMAGHWWSGDSGQDFAYVTKNADNGFSVAIQEQTSAGLQWKGVVWTEPGSSGVQFNNTLFIPVDVNNDGLLDLYYATSADWSQPGFTIGYMQNTGSGLTYGGTKQTFSNLALNDVKFLAGKWSSNGGPAFAYVTKNSDNGFSVATFAADSSGNLSWQGVKWTEPGSSGVQFNNTTFTPIDATGSGVDDLLYSSSTNPSSPGFSTGEMANDGTNPFTWAGTKMTQSSLALNQVRFIPAHWDGPGREAFAYVSQRPDGGFDMAVEGFDSSGNGSWQGIWFSAPNVPYASTVLVPADTRGNGYTDLYYATVSNGGSGFDTAVAYNYGNNSGLTYGGQQWDQTGLALNQTVFLPQF
ncbi:hypothetical protein GCM10009839_63410 [Catenulispora yoronensis]|uniref:Peptidase C51 domain-containing protein n=2 Tax=Catenulispora yoronensis TaxID=450799 RepID=A0ABP5GK94_9ACTN